jgi:hypothetical protein
VSDLLGMQRAVWRSTRSTTEKIVLLAIIDHYSDSSPEPWPSVPTLAACASLGRTAVLEALSSLERDGVITVRRIAGRPNRYDLSQVQTALAPALDKQKGENEARMEPVRRADGSQETEPAAAGAEPVRDADQSGEVTSPFAGRDQSACRTGPVRLADPKDPKKDPTKEPTAVRARVSGPDPSMPLVERARLVLREPRAAAQLRPHEWPETKQIASAYGAATGSQRSLSELRRDSGLRAIVELIAAGYAVDDITWLASSVPREAWWRSGDRIRGLGSLSIEVASRALGERAAPPRPSVAKAPRSGESDEARRIHRNTLLENAAAGWYGAEFRRAAVSGDGLRELVDVLEHMEALGTLARGAPRAARDARPQAR